MLLMLLGIALVWLATVVVMVGVCVAASRADREQQLRPGRVSGAAQPGLRAIT